MEFIRGANGLVSFPAYQCQPPGVEMVAVDMTHRIKCLNSRHNLEPGKYENAIPGMNPEVFAGNDQLGQPYTILRALKTTSSLTFLDDDAIQCKMDLTIELMLCSNDSASGIFPIWKRMIPISKEECYLFYTTQSITYNGQRFNLRHPGLEELTSFQNKDECNLRQPNTIETTEYYDMYPATTLHTIIRAVEGTFNVFLNKVWFHSLTMTRPIRARYTDQTAWSWEEGRLNWRLDHRNCTQNHLAEIHLGIATLFKLKNHDDLREGIILIRTGHSDYIGTFITEIFYHCNSTCYRTHLKNLSFCDVNLQEQTGYEQQHSQNLLSKGLDPARVQIQKQIGLLQSLP